MKQNRTWDVTELPKGNILVGCKWVFTLKYKVYGIIKWYKACLVAKEFTYTYEIDYIETFVPVTKMNIIRMLLSLVANLDCPLQLNIKNEFLNGVLKEKVFMTMLPEFYKKGTNRVWKLERSLCGVKKSIKAWFHRFSKVTRKQHYQ